MAHFYWFMKNKTKLSSYCIITLLKKYNGNDIILLTAQAIKKRKEFVLTHPQYKLSFIQYCRLRYYIYLRKNNYPLAYITKHKEFYGLDFYINQSVLVPRSETEMIIDEILKIKINQNYLLLDIGTGSGCIPIAITKQINQKIDTIATDISRSALRIAKKNARKHKVNIKFLQGDLLSPLLKHSLFYTAHTSKIIITANLPYLTNKQFNNELSIQKEPKQALIADNKDGLLLYQKLLQQIKQLLTYNLQITIFLEINPNQAKEIKKIIKQYLPNFNITIKKDLANLDRLVCLN